MVDSAADAPGFEPNQSGVDVEHIELRMPAEPVLWPIARQLINVIAARAHFPAATVEDLQIAVSELCTICAADLDRHSTIAFSVDLEPEQIEVECRAIPQPGWDADPAPPPVPGIYPEAILHRLADAHGIEDLDGSRRAWLRRHAEA